MFPSIDVDEKDLRAILRVYNPWWGEGRFTAKPFRRSLFNALAADLFSSRQILALYGPAGGGKSTLLRQLVEYLIRTEAIAPGRIFLFSFDEPLMVNEELRESFFDELMTIAERQAANGTVFIFLDEIQRFAEWPRHLKRFHDSQLPLRFVIAGPESMEYRKARESLSSGRVRDYRLPPFSFREFLYFHEADNRELLDFANSARTFGERIQREPSMDWKSLDNMSVPLKAGGQLFERLSELLDRYFIEGGFPGSWALDDPVSKQQYLFDLQVQRVLSGDASSSADFRKPENVKRFMLSLLERPGREINVERAAQHLGISRLMLERYLRLLEAADTVKMVARFSLRPFTFRRGIAKGYLTDLALRTTVLKTGPRPWEDEDLLGVYAENVVMNALRGFEGITDLMFYQEPGGSVDFIVRAGPGRYLPIEVNYRTEAGSTASIESFLSSRRAEAGIVVTKQPVPNREQERLLCFPLPVFLLFF